MSADYKSQFHHVTCEVYCTPVSMVGRLTSSLTTGVNMHSFDTTV